MEYEDILGEVGLTPAESKVYIALLRLGSSTIGPIIKQSGLHSSVVYNSIQRLSEKGLVAYTTKGKIKYFAATDPMQLTELLKEKEARLGEAMPKLKGIINSTRGSQTVFIYEGPKATRIVFNDILHTALGPGDEHLVYVISKYDSDISDFIRRWDYKRVRAGIRKRVILTEDAKEWIEFYRKQPLTKIRVVSNLYDTKMIVNIYANKVLLRLWEKYSFYIMIENADIANNFRQHFKLMWAAAK